MPNITMNRKRIFILKKELPFLAKGTRFAFHDSTGHIHWILESGLESEFPLRSGLAGYLYLLSTEKKYMKLTDTIEQ